MSALFHLFFAIDSGYHLQLQVLWTSLFMHHEKGSLSFHVLHSGLSPQQEQRLRSLAEDHQVGCHLHVIPASWIRNLPVNELFPSPVQFFRFFISEYLPADATRVLYLDTDTIACRSLTPLMGADLQGCIVGAVEDLDAQASCERLGIPRTARYFNSGVLLIDPRLWSQYDIPAQGMAYLNAHRHDPSKRKYPDQDALNMVLQHAWCPLASQWNVFACNRWFQPEELSSAQRSAILHPGIIHYTGPEKPWLPQFAPPYRKLYRNYARRAGVHFPFCFSLNIHRRRWQQERHLQSMRKLHKAAGLLDDF